MNNFSKKRPENKKGMRTIDQKALSTLSWWQENYSLVKKTRIATWKGLAIITFVAGSAIALIWTVSMNIQSQSGASINQAVLTLDPQDLGVVAGETFNLDVILDTKDNDVTVARAVVKYDPIYFEFINYSTENSRFAVDNPCVSNNESCRIVSSDPEAGVFDITLGTPNPINTNSGTVATLTFKARQTAPLASSMIKLAFKEVGNQNSGVAMKDSVGTEILGSVNNAVVTVGAAVCADVAYSEWSVCQLDGVQTRTITSRAPDNCVVRDPILTRDCELPPPPPGETCAEFVYSEWGTCQEDGVQTRTIVSSLPTNCVGGSPILTQKCGDDNDDDGNNVVDNDDGDDPIVGEDIKIDKPKVKVGKDKESFEKSKKVYSNSDKFKFQSQDTGLENGKVQVYEDGKLKKEVSVDAEGSWKASIKSDDGTHDYQIKYFDSSNNEIASSKYTIKVDTKDPEITDLPKLLSKSRGEKVWWKAKDNQKIDHYKYAFDGKSKNTENASMIIPVKTKPGYYTLKVTAYDKAGNSGSKSITIRVK